MKRQRIRAAHLGEVVLDGQPYTVRFKDGRIKLRKKHSSYVSSLTLEPCARILPGQAPLFRT